MFTNQLTHWQDTKQQAEKFLDMFRKYKQMHNVELRHRKGKWALFTDGGTRVGKEYKSERRSI